MWAGKGEYLVLVLTLLSNSQFLTTITHFPHHTYCIFRRISTCCVFSLKQGLCCIQCKPFPSTECSKVNRTTFIYRRTSFFNCKDNGPVQMETAKKSCILERPILFSISLSTRTHIHTHFVHLCPKQHSTMLTPSSWNSLNRWFRFGCRTDSTHCLSTRMKCRNLLEGKLHVKFWGSIYNSATLLLNALNFQSDV